MRVCILVNGNKDGIFGRRVQQLCRYTPSFKNAAVLYRDDAGRFFSIFRFAAHLILIRPQLVYVEAVAFAGCAASCILKPFLRFKYIISTGDDYRNIIKDFYGVFWGFLAGILEKITYAIADVIITLSPFQKDHLISKGYKDVLCLEHGVDTDIFKPFSVKELKQKLGLGGFLIIGLVGSIVLAKRHRYAYGWDVVEIIKILKDKPVKGLIVGDGNGLSMLKKLAESYGISDRIVFAGRVEHDEIPFYINCINICISTQTNNITGRTRTPINTKTSEYLACGKFIISTDVGYNRRIVEKVGMLTPYRGIKDETYPNKVAKIIENILSDRAILDKGRNGIDIAKQRLNFKKLSSELEEATKELMHG